MPEIAAPFAPWIPYVAIEYLTTILQPDWRVFEWGAGGSTIYWALRCAQVTSIEHDPGWYHAVQTALGLWASDDCYDCELKWIPGEAPAYYLSRDPNHPDNYRRPECPELNYQRYARAIDGRGLFDLVFVDGVARPSCVAHSLASVRPGGWLCLDNSDQAHWLTHYFDRPLLTLWKRHDHHGSGRGRVPWTTTFWQKPEEG